MGGMEKHHKMSTQDYLPVSKKSSTLGKGGCGGCGSILRVEREVVLHLVRELRGKGRGQGAVPLVLEVKSQGQLEIKLDCPTLMGSTQGIADMHINLEKTKGRTCEKPEPVPSIICSLPLSTHIPGCVERHITHSILLQVTHWRFWQWLFPFSSDGTLGDVNIHMNGPASPWPLNSMSFSSQRPSPRPTLWP